jgi:hypothetical protein
MDRDAEAARLQVLILAGEPAPLPITLPKQSSHPLPSRLLLPFSPLLPSFAFLAPLHY